MIPAGCPAHRPDEQSHSPPTTNSVGGGVPDAPLTAPLVKPSCHCEASAHTGGVDIPQTPELLPCHCEASAYTGCGNP